MTYKLTRYLCHSLILLLPSVICVAEITILDDRGSTISLQEPAKRIVSLAPHLTENLFAIGAGERIVGVTSYSNYPPAANAIERIGTYKNFDLERIYQLQPDIVVGWFSGNPTAQIASIEQLGIPVFLSEPRSPEHVADELLKLGQITGSNEQAREVSTHYLGQISALKNTYRDRDAVSVFYQVWHQPLITLNGDHVISKLMEGCGGSNVFSDIDTLAPKIQLEAIFDRDPEAIIASGMGNSRPEWLDNWRSYEFLRAVKQENLLHIHPDLIQRHTIRLAEGMKHLCIQLQQVREKRGKALPK